MGPLLVNSKGSIGFPSASSQMILALVQPTPVAVPVIVTPTRAVPAGNMLVPEPTVGDVLRVSKVSVVVPLGNMLKAGLSV
jgi:hypothetical protein